MKISDLKIGNYVVVNDLGAGKYSSGMRVIGRVVEIDDKGNYAIIESLPKHRYEITDFNDFELWSKQIEDKTESMSDSEGLSGFTVDKKLLEEAKEKGIDELRKRINQSNDLQQRKRKDENVGLFKIKDLKVGYKVKMLDDDMTGEISEIADNGKYAEIKIDNGVYRGINDNCDFTITEWNSVPEYAEDTVNSPSHYNYGDIEVIDFIEQVTKHYNPNVAYHIGNAIKYLARSPHKNGKEDVAKAKWYIERAFENWDVK
ncbi:DUF3310 domain-containing protein [Staphylococcus ureilyticus]|uniref:DUF3310 domain-containing protein n=1 Tax=Staphylococcus ureilyticus TaxID=94138 RepID=A0AB34AFQ1_STAUR|nr:DUF3310 domain-containing protein [Staphylococcus ureilyticus]MCT1914016.1 DUF3310 domain-containing protein [Staphylococcus ureilyticus]GEQ01960.1 hypothetical protein SCO02_04010 [Staphylococcus ureilyticus]